jgi:L-ascorbate metabolism protein UlaG (beta-lactamase superfamily)
MILIIVLGAHLVALLAFLRHPQFGKLPSGERLKRIKAADNYRNGAFQNLSVTPTFPEGVTMWRVMHKFLFGKVKDTRPTKPIPTVKSDLRQLAATDNTLVWFGHSSYFLQLEGKTFLIDPVFSGSASPLSFGTRAFPGTDIYTSAELPDIDVLLLSHDHWDHLDYATVKALEPHVRQVICGLGVGAHLEHWGYAPDKIQEKNWYEQVRLPDNFTVHLRPARHFSGRSFFRNKSLWVSFVVESPKRRVFLGGDSGYDTHFARIGEELGPFDLAVLENGQYDAFWPYIHTMPGEILEIAQQLRAKKILPVHSAKFKLGNHPWYEPLELITRHNEEAQLPIITPMIGEQVDLDRSDQVFQPWWRSMM